MNVLFILSTITIIGELIIFSTNLAFSGRIFEQIGEISLYEGACVIGHILQCMIFICSFLLLFFLNRIYYPKKKEPLESIKASLITSFILIFAHIVEYVLLTIWTWINVRKIFPMWNLIPLVPFIVIIVSLYRERKSEKYYKGYWSREIEKASRLYEDKRLSPQSQTEIKKPRTYQQFIYKDKREPRRTISRKLRFEILRRDDYTCIICGRKAPEVELHVDHIIPWSINKKHEKGNLMTTCKDCNLGKSDTRLSDEEISRIKRKINENKYKKSA